jgi:hypothetical protein
VTSLLAVAWRLASEVPPVVLAVAPFLWLRGRGAAAAAMMWTRLTGPGRAFTLVLALLTAVQIGYAVLHSDLRWDDHAVIRPYSAAELRSALTGDWLETPGMTPGYRPLSVWLYHAAYRLCGEHNAGYLLLNGTLWVTAFLVFRSAERAATGRADITVATALLLTCCNNAVSVLAYACELPRVAALIPLAAAARALVGPDTRRAAAAAAGALLVALLLRDELLFVAPAVLVAHALRHPGDLPPARALARSLVRVGWILVPACAVGVWSVLIYSAKAPPVALEPALVAERVFHFMAKGMRSMPFFGVLAAAGILLGLRARQATVLSLLALAVLSAGLGNQPGNFAHYRNDITLYFTAWVILAAVAGAGTGAITRRPVLLAAGGTWLLWGSASNVLQSLELNPRSIHFAESQVIGMLTPPYSLAPIPAERRERIVPPLLAAFGAPDPGRLAALRRDLRDRGVRFPWQTDGWYCPSGYFLFETPSPLRELRLRLIRMNPFHPQPAAQP